MRKNTKKALSRLLIGILWLSLLGTRSAESRQVVCAAEVSGGDVSGNESDTPGTQGIYPATIMTTREMQAIYPAMIMTPRGTRETYPATTVITLGKRETYPVMTFRQGMCRKATSCR